MYAGDLPLRERERERIGFGIACICTLLIAFLSLSKNASKTFRGMCICSIGMSKIGPHVCFLGRYNQSITNNLKKPEKIAGFQSKLYNVAMITYS